VASHDVGAFQEIYHNDWRRGLDQHQVEAAEAAASIYIDPEAAETTCPACMTTFATGPAECPECGLYLGG
jgi:Zn finger protein HypA/HybF involved in hydrogenase expression